MYCTGTVLGAGNTKVKTFSSAPASSASALFSPLTFSNFLFSLLTWIWPSELCLSLARPYLSSTADSCSCISFWLQWQTTTSGLALSYVFMWCPCFKFTPALTASFLLWRIWLRLLSLLLLQQLLPIASIYCVTGVLHTFIISFIPIILPIKRTCFLQRSKWAAIHPIGLLDVVGFRFICNGPN